MVPEIVRILGTSIGKPELPWVQFTDEQTLAGMKAAGMSEAIAGVYVEMGSAINSGVLFEDFNRQKPEVWGSTKFADFAYEFVGVYNLGK